MDILIRLREFIFQEALFFSALRIAFIVALCFAGLWLLRSLVGRFKDLLKRRSKRVEDEKRAETLGQVINGTGWVLVVTVALMMILSEFGIDLKPIIAAAGIGGIAIGFGAQNLIKDLISGFFMLAERKTTETRISEIDSPWREG